LADCQSDQSRLPSDLGEAEQAEDDVQSQNSGQQIGSSLANDQPQDEVNNCSSSTQPSTSTPDENVITAKYTNAPKKVRFEEKSDSEPPSPVPPQEVINSFAAINQAHSN
jgi:hypothetical protein